MYAAMFFFFLYVYLYIFNFFIGRYMVFVQGISIDTRFEKRKWVTVKICKYPCMDLLLVNFSRKRSTVII
uniref:Uncharacterized protein n=1 Tax=Cannabis sativa TaxID=3483 RepID=A0A803QZW4_CANSA